MPSPIFKIDGVMPAQAGIHLGVTRVHSRLRGNDMLVFIVKFILAKVLGSGDWIFSSFYAEGSTRSTLFVE